MKVRGVLSLIGISIFIYILYKIGLSQLIEEISNLEYSWLFVAISSIGIVFLFQTLKWFVIAKKQKIEVSFIRAFYINLIANFYGFLTPSRIGTMIRAEYLRDYTSIEKATSNFVIDKILDIASVFLLGIFFAIFLGEKFNTFGAVKYMIIVLVFSLIALVLLSRKEWSYKISKLLFSKIVKEDLKNKIGVRFDKFYEHAPKESEMLFFFFLNIINWILLYAVSWAIGNSLGINLGFIYYLAIMPLGTIISLIPITINGLGTREALLIALFGIFGIASEKVVSMSLLSIVLLNILPAIITIFLMLVVKKR